MQTFRSFSVSHHFNEGYNETTIKKILFDNGMVINSVKYNDITTTFETTAFDVVDVLFTDSMLKQYEPSYEGYIVWA